MGEVFGGRYELIDLIGEGGMGAVWRARDLKLNRIVAAKVLRQSDASALLRFVREQGLRVDHPNVIAPLGWIGEDHQVLFTMRIVAGGSLATLIGDYGALPPRFTAEILRQLLSGLRAVHAAHLVHRDVKPANILLDATAQQRPHAYLTDFGIAVDLAGPRLTETGMVHGTPGYLAPELMSFGDVTPAVDMFAVGMVGASMLTGASARDIDLNAVAPEGTPESLWSLIRDLTNTDPDERPKATAALNRLEVPELAWHDGAARDVEVFQQLDPLVLDDSSAMTHSSETPRTATFKSSIPSPGSSRQPTPPTLRVQPLHTPVPGESQQSTNPLLARPQQPPEHVMAAPPRVTDTPAPGKGAGKNWVLFVISLLVLIGGVILLVFWYVQ